MAEPTPHYMLHASLPHLPELLRAKHLPMSRVRLERRLRILPQSQLAETRRLRSVLSWEELGDASDDSYLVEARAFVETVSDPVLKEAVEWRLEVRTLVAALRQRKLGLHPQKGRWGLARYDRIITKHWPELDFSLGAAFSWLRHAAELVQAGNTLELEKLLLVNTDRQYRRLARGHDFTYAGIALYLLRWQLLERWLSYDAGRAQSRFEELVSRALSGVTELERWT